MADKSVDVFFIFDNEHIKVDADEVKETAERLVLKKTTGNLVVEHQIPLNQIMRYQVIHHG